MMPFLTYLMRVWRANQGFAGATIGRHWQIYKEWRDMVRSGKSPLELEMPWITLMARDYLQEYLQRLSRPSTRVFEYGSGGSGLFFLRYAAEVVSVEHDKKWFAAVSEQARLRKEPGWRITLAEPEPLPPGHSRPDPSDPASYGSAGEAYDGMHFKKYVTLIDDFPNASFDIVLVDGRSRPACLRHGAPKVKKNGLLVLDNAERDYYLAHNPIPAEQFTLVHSSYSALVSSPQLTRTNIYLRHAVA